MHIAFLTLFLGLISGRVPIELAVTGPVPGTPGMAGVAVDLALDGAPAELIAGPPFKAHIDLGKDLLPHHLVARVLDLKGVELARTEQWINLPQPLATVVLTPETGPEGRLAAVGVSFQAETHEAPSAWTAALDGSPLPVQAGRVVLPPYKADLPHVLTVEGHFPSGLSAQRDLAFGGGLAGEVTTELTAILVRTEHPLPTPAALDGGFVAREPGASPAAPGAAAQPLNVSAVEEGAAGEILAVRDPGAATTLDELGRHASGLPLLRSELPVGERDRVRLVDAGASWFSGEGTTSAIFGVSPELDGRKWGLYWWLSHTDPSRPYSRAQLADAVAVAGIQALADQRRRVVLLVLSGTTTEKSHWDIAAVRQFLAAIRVPLYVWSLRSPPDPAAVAAWGKIEDVSNLHRLSSAYRELSQATSPASASSGCRAVTCRSRSPSLLKPRRGSSWWRNRSAKISPCTSPSSPSSSAWSPAGCRSSSR